jgi:tRNA nucleotidyltransferase (CCA-adding enzyme)
MKTMVANGEVDALVAERVWQELARGLLEKNPSRFITTLRDCGALQKILPEVDALFGVPQPPQHHPEIDCGIHTMMVLDDAAHHGYALEVRFAAGHDLGKGNTPKDILLRHIGHEARGVDLPRVCEPARAADCRDLGLWWRATMATHRARELRPDTIALRFKMRCRRKPDASRNSCTRAADARYRTGDGRTITRRPIIFSAC